MAHAVIALQSLLKGLNKVILNPEALARDLENNWAVVAEGIQTILRREGFPKPYEALKALTRTNAHITRESIAAFIETLDVAESVKEELRALSPSTYTGRVPVGRNRHRKQRQDPKASCLYSSRRTVTPCSNAPYSRKTGSCPVHY